MKTTGIYMVSQDAVQLYANLVGDDNPLHTDPEYVEREDTFNDENVVHGTLIQGWFSAQLNEIGEVLDAEVIIVDLFTEFHNPVEVGESVQVTADVVGDEVVDEKSIVDVGLRAVDPEYENHEFATGSATLMIDQTVSRGDGD